jgi:hypothetical protein
MAILRQSILDGCSSIPDFINTGSRMVFYQASAPTSWTKVTTNELNHAAFRVVTGFGGGSGGSSGFTDVFTTRSVPLPQHNHTGYTGSAGNHSHGGSTGSAGNHSHSGSTGSAGAHNHGIYDPGHQHTVPTVRNGETESGNGDDGGSKTNSTTSRNSTGISINGVGHHSHSLSINANGSHSHVLAINSAGDHSHGVTINNAGTAGASMNFAVKYVDVIICSKD